MASWRRGTGSPRWTPWTGRGVWLAALAAAGLGFGCGGLASTFLDLPEEAPKAPEGVAKAQPLPAQEDTARPPIELILDPDSVLALLPKDRAGNVDWVAALREGIIQPRASLPGAPQPSQVGGFRFDFYFKGGLEAYFPHSSHVEWSTCRSCHPGIYRYRGEGTSMAAIQKGESCGRCHGKVAFWAVTCERCHPQLSMPEGRLKPALLGDLTLAPKEGVAPERASFPPARFPHWVHRIRYRCMACHPDPFEHRAGATEMTMEAMRRGETCGECHNGQAAFALMQCPRCHLPPLADRDTGS